MNRIKVLLFATLRDQVGAKSIDVEMPEQATVRGLKDRLSELYPNAKPHFERALVAINREYSPDERALPENGEVALFPPVSGG